MTQQKSQLSRLAAPDLWSLGAVVIGLVVVAPVLAVIWLAFHPTENIWPHLMATVLPRYVANTLILAAGVGALSVAMGTGAAWLVVMYRFPLVRLLDQALLFPLAIPAYIGAYALVDFLDYSGPLQGALRLAMGWTSAKDYAFPEVHSLGFATIVLAAAFYPYVYLLARAAFREQSGGTYEVARALGGMTAWAAMLACLVPLTLGFVLPVAVMVTHAVQKPQAWLAPGLGQAVINTLMVGAIAAVLTVAAATFLIQGLRLSRLRLARVILPMTSLGYAAPGAVLAVGILIPLAALDHKVADAILAVTGHDPGLILTGTATALVLAYMVRFFGIAQGAVEAAFGRIAPTLPMAARSLGQSAGGVLRHIYLPLMRGSVSTALLMVFVDCVKELPATLMVRPFNFNTLSTRAYDLASLEKITEAAPAALLVIAFSLTAVAIMARSSRA